MTKILSNGGWLNSTDGAFNQPSSYVGMQYRQRNPDLPPLDYIKDFLKENERIRKEHEAYRAAASPNDAKFNELMEKATGKGLTGQLQELSGAYAQFKQDFFQKYKGDAVFSDEAKQDLARITQLFGPSTLNELQQNQELWKSQKERVEKEEIGSNIWTDGQHVLVEDSRGQRKVVPVAIYAESMEDPELRKQYRALTNSEAIDWKDKNWRRGEADRYVIGGQMSMKNFVDFIDSQFTNLGHTASGRSGEQIADLTNYLQANGINVANGNVIQQVSQKFKDNQGQLGQVMQRIYETMPPEAKNAMIAQMLSKGENPFKMVKIKTKDGEAEVSNLALNMQSIVGSSAGAKRVSESETGSGFKSLGSTLGEGSGSGEAAIDYMQMIMNAPQLAPGAKEVDFIDPQTGKVVRAPNVPLTHEKVKEKIPGINQTEYVTDDRTIYLEGNYVSIGRGNDSKNPREAVILPGTGDITFVNQTKKKSNGEVLIGPDGNPVVEKVGMVRRSMVINTDTMNSINAELPKPLFEVGFWSAKGINGAEALVKKIGADDVISQFGLSEEDGKKVKQLSGSTYVVTYWQPVHETELRGDDSNKNDRNILNYQYFQGFEPFLNERDKKGSSQARELGRELIQ